MLGGPRECHGDQCDHGESLPGGRVQFPSASPNQLEGVTTSLEDALLQLVDELEAHSLRVIPPERPHFALEHGHGEFVLTIQTDNGGGPMTCHLIEDRLEVRQRDGEFDVLRNAELIPCPTMVWTEQGVVDWLRTTASEALPAHLDSSREEL